MFSELFPIVLTSDMPRALGFYRDLLGGSISYQFPGPDGEPAYVALDIGSAQLGLADSPDAHTASSRPISLWVYTDDCDTAVEVLRLAGIRITAEPANQPWGDRSARPPSGWE